MFHAIDQRNQHVTVNETSQTNGTGIDDDREAPDADEERRTTQDSPANKPITEILLTNVISILSDNRRKFTKYAFERSGADILILTETNLNESVMNGTIQIPGYKLVSRSDRKVHANHVSRTITATGTADDQVEVMPGIDNDLIIGHDKHGNPIFVHKRKKSGGGTMIYVRYELLPTNNKDTIVWNRSACQGRVQISGFQVPGMLVVGVYNSIFNLCRIDNHKLMFKELSDVIRQAKKKTHPAISSCAETGTVRHSLTRHTLGNPG